MSVAAAAPPPPPGTLNNAPTMNLGMEKAIQKFKSILPLVIAVSIFGASVWASMVSQIGTPSRWSESAVRVFMGISWLLFTCAMMIAVFSSIFLTEETINKKKNPIFLGGLVAWMLVLTIVGFVFMGLVTVAYAGAVGWVAIVVIVGFGGLFAAVALDEKRTSL
ncbi:hypothetical protein K505DRAFT_322866 [Melanomma pulvis-pyrius CBS 109.77]|uniref:Uncharacterized protein n=1 Tax=Melanomma pulvis-pyrius CBS 109.77 TaxID=1314802 RepID=A0A6A6XKE8_9PLEO|nr:hypothetical protein K505DRAFT_322866 [Melanomma pulvis-pyrius CBS 109.77]